jgi:hypothetical protein
MTASIEIHIYNYKILSLNPINIYRRVWPYRACDFHDFYSVPTLFLELFRSNINKDNVS